jgi:hypothetical protein
LAYRKHDYILMRTYVHLASAATISALLFAPLASADLLSSSIFSTSQNIEKRQNTAATSSAIGIPPSQYWEGNGNGSPESAAM